MMFQKSLAAALVAASLVFLAQPETAEAQQRTARRTHTARQARQAQTPQPQETPQAETPAPAESAPQADAASTAQTLGETAGVSQENQAESGDAPGAEGGSESAQAEDFAGAAAVEAPVWTDWVDWRVGVRKLMAQAEAEKVARASKEANSPKIDPRTYRAPEGTSPGTPALVISEENFSLGIPKIRDVPFALMGTLPSGEVVTPALQDGASEAADKKKPAGDFQPFELDVVVFGEEQGELAEIDCRDATGGGNVYNYAAHVSFAKAVEKRSAEKGRPSPVILGIGDTIFPGTFSNYLLSRGTAGKAQMAHLLSAVPYDLMSLGNHDFGPERPEMDVYFAEARKASLPYLAANLKCTDEAPPICRTGMPDNKPYRIIQRGGLNIGLTAILDPSVAQQVGKDRLEGIEILPPKPALKKLVREMRAAGADLVIALFHQGLSKSSSDLERLLEGVWGLDLVVTEKLFKGDDVVTSRGRPDFTAMGQIVEPLTRTRLVGAGSSHNAASLITISIDRSELGRGYRITRAMPRTFGTAIFGADEAVKAELDSAARGFCGEWGEPLNPKATLSQEFTAEDMTLFILNAMRFTAETEVAMMNTGAFRNLDRFPLRGTLSKADLKSSLPFGGPLITARIKGADLEKLCASIGKGLSAAGISVDDKGDVTVNGRPLDKKRFYTIALNEFLAEGSGDFIPPKKLIDVEVWNPADGPLAMREASAAAVPEAPGGAGDDAEKSEAAEAKAADDARQDAMDRAEVASSVTAQEQPELTLPPVRNSALDAPGPTLAAVVADAVSSGRFAVENPDGTLTLSPDKSFPNLHLKMLWLLGGYLNASYSHMIVHNPHEAAGYDGDYDKSRLTATATDHLNIDFKLMANGASRNHGWDNDFVIQYATTREKGPDESNVFEEDKDIVRLRSAYKYLGQRADLGELWYVPVPFVEGQVETELTKPSDSDNHPLDLTLIAGLLLKLHKKLEYKIGINTKIDALEKNAQPSVGLFTGYRLLKTDLFEIFDRAVQFESEAEYFFNAVGKNRIHEFRWENRLFFPITEHASLTASFNMYLYRTKFVGETGRAIEAMAGINVALERMVQKF